MNLEVSASQEDWESLPFVEPAKVYALRTARFLANALIDAKGFFKKNEGEKIVEDLAQKAYVSSFSRVNEEVKRLEILRKLRRFISSESLQSALHQISRPHANLFLDKLIRASLLMEEKKRITDRTARVAVLTSLLYPLRQNVGSCFATAPAIMIQEEMPLQFLRDIQQIFATGCLKRVVEGEEYAVPMSYHWGFGDFYTPIQTTIGTLKKALRAHPIIRIIESRIGITFQESLFGQKDQELHMSPAQIIERQFQEHFQVSKEDLEAFEKKEELLVLNDFLPVANHEVGKFANCKNYLKAFQMAQELFMSYSECALLKSWEFTLASLSESKASFSKWNLFIALGMQGETQHGVGDYLRTFLNEKIEALQSEVEELQLKYDHVFASAKSLEGRIQRSESERQMQWALADYQMRKHEIHRILVLRDELHDKGRELASLFPFLVEFYTERFKEYFQEVYDVRMRELEADIFDDRPAGFRLLYKHGRSNPGLWTLIYTAPEFIKALVSFFIATEVELSQTKKCEHLKSEVSELVTRIIQGIRSQEFLQASMSRLVHKGRQDQQRQTPWAYVSGGAMSTLVSCYFHLPAPPKELSRWVESPQELLAFWIDSLRDMPLSTQKRYQKDPHAGMLAFSPTHAFQLKPGGLLFKEAWDHDLYAFSWIRDRLEEPQQAFLAKQSFSFEAQRFLLEKLLDFFPRGYHPIVKQALKDLPFNLTPSVFRERVCSILSYEKWMKEIFPIKRLRDAIDALLFQNLPFMSEKAFISGAQSVVSDLHLEVNTQVWNPFLKKIQQEGVFSSQQLREFISQVCLVSPTPLYQNVPYLEKICQALREKGLMMPAPLLIGDTNWEGYSFGFSVNPGTLNFELWIFSHIADSGRPMSMWSPYLDGTVKKEWGIYSEPQQYTA